MAMYKGEFDITKTIRIIERLKSQLLSNVSALFSNMAESNSANSNENIDILADVIILSYLLSDKLGVSNEALDIKLINKLRLASLQNEENEEWTKEILTLSKHLNKSREIK
ncbi:hypothetical protein SH1V18_31270 [Vallitalea longa]|uniref:MazG-like family protein n=1 Tax=Vallitalea longa TaxID=2936439 RepID=A0A9W6DGL0_9FIRM|nr:MazG-like family protein [Vallitalea longa]GKX30647.1 hypothetical protein SH1V18_31270 [Vallitalea longa]